MIMTIMVIMMIMINIKNILLDDDYDDHGDHGDHDDHDDVLDGDENPAVVDWKEKCQAMTSHFAKEVWTTGNFESSNFGNLNFGNYASAQILWVRPSFGHSLLQIGGRPTKVAAIWPENEIKCPLNKHK